MCEGDKRDSPASSPENEHVPCTSAVSGFALQHDLPKAATQPDLPMAYPVTVPKGAPPSAKAKAVRPSRRMKPVAPNLPGAQERLDARFAGLKPEDFDEDGVVVFTAFKLNPPPNFEEVWLDIESVDIENILADDRVGELQTSAAAVLLLGDPNIPLQVNLICMMAEVLDNLNGCPPLFWIPHNVYPDSQSTPFPDLNIYNEVLQCGADAVIPGEPKGCMLATHVRSRRNKLMHLSDKANSIINDRRALDAKAFHLKARIKYSIWEYLRQRLQSGLPAVNPDCPPGIPTTIEGMRVGNLLGEGASGEVFPLFRPGETDGAFTEVLKCIPKKKITNIAGLKAIKHQLAIMKVLSDIHPHPNITRLHRVYHIDAYILLRMENGGALNLYKRLKMREQDGHGCHISEKKVVTLLKEGIQAVAHLHSCQISHRDIKPENACIRETPENIVLKLTDFDVAIECQRGQVVDNICGTFPFTAPEMYFQDDYKPFPTDIWSLGIMQGEIFCGLHLLNRALRLPAYRQQFEQENARHKRGKCLEIATKKFISTKISDYFSQEDAASQMLSNKVRQELSKLAHRLLAMYASMITMPASKRATAPEILNLLETLLAAEPDVERTIF